MNRESFQMNENEKFIICKCPTCGKELRMKANSISVFCLGCKTWSKPNSSEEENNDKINDE